MRLWSVLEVHTGGKDVPLLKCNASDDTPLSHVCVSPSSKNDMLTHAETPVSSSGKDLPLPAALKFKASKVMREVCLLVSK